MRMLFKKLILSLEAEYFQWFCWIPVGLGIGIALYFSWIIPFALPIFIVAGGIILLLFVKTGARFFLWALIFISLGVLLAYYRTHSISLSLISKPARNQIIEDYLTEISAHPRHPNACRWIIGQVRLTVPRSLCQSAHLGDFVKIKADLLPFSLPVSPHSFHWRRHYYFKNLKATGRIKQILNVTSAQPSFLAQIRHQLGGYIKAHLSPQEGAIANALIIGDTSGISKSIRQQFADAGIAHILAISGLHMTLVTGLMFLLIRRSLALIPSIALRYPIKLWALCGAMLANFAYMLISGMGFPVIRSFCMGIFVMVGFILNRRAISLHSAAIAAILILTLYPESLLSVSFQLSFAAVVALIAGHASSSLQNRFVRYACSMVLTTCLATLATFPFTIETFQRLTLQAITGNLLAIPLTSFWIMPCALLSLTFPVFCPLWEKGIHFLIDIAAFVSHLPGAAIALPKPPWFFLPLTTLGGLWLCLWKTKWRWWGLPIIFSAIGLWYATPSNIPDIMISRSIMAYHDQGTLYVSQLKKGQFDYETWRREWNIPHIKEWKTPVTEWKGYTLVAEPWRLKDRLSSGFTPKHKVLTNGRVRNALLSRKNLKTNCFVKDKQIFCVPTQGRPWD